MGLRDTNIENILEEMIDEEIIDNDELTLNEQIDYIDNKLDETKQEINEIIETFREETKKVSNEMIENTNEARIVQEQIRRTKSDLDSVKSFVNSIAASERNTINSKNRAEDILKTILDLEHNLKTVERETINKLNTKEFEIITNTKKIEETLNIKVEEHNKRITSNINKAKKTNIFTLMSIAASVVIGGFFLFTLIEKLDYSDDKVTRIEEQTKTLDNKYKSVNFDNYISKDTQIVKNTELEDEIKSIKNYMLEQKINNEKEMESLRLTYLKQLQNMQNNTNISRVEEKVAPTTGGHKLDPVVEKKVERKVVPTLKNDVYVCELELGKNECNRYASIEKIKYWKIGNEFYLTNTKDNKYVLVGRM
jgi:hypothetical protein